MAAIFWSRKPSGGPRVYTSGTRHEDTWHPAKRIREIEFSAEDVEILKEYLRARDKAREAAARHL